MTAHEADPPPAAADPGARRCPGEGRAEHRTGRFRALGHDFGCRTTDGALHRYLERVLAALAVPGEPPVWYSLLASRASPATYDVYFGAERLVRRAEPERALRRLLWHTNQRAVASCSDRVVVHAAAVERAGAGVLLPATRSAGKTTLAAGLVRRGLRYLTDEAAAIDPATGRIQPYPKPLSIGRGSWEVLADLEPDTEPPGTGHRRWQWQVPPDAVRPGSVAPATAPRLVVTPRYVPGVAAHAEPVGRADMLLVLADNTFDFHASPWRRLSILAAVVRRSRCYRLWYGDLAAACETVLELLDDQPSPDGGLRA